MPEITCIPKGSTVAVGMSGGVDSTITAHLLVQQGLRVVGLTMKIWDGAVALKEIGRPGCFGPGEAEDLAAAQAAARRLEIPHHVINLADCFKRSVLDYFRSEYLAGRTPNPCMRCNHAVKFGALLEEARARGIHFDYFATGHYAQVKFDPLSKRHLLLRGADLNKDQSYFLSRLKQEQLAKLVLPLGVITKDEVKEAARRLGWQALADRRESQDFIESGDYGALFEAKDSKPGPIVDVQGDVLGAHEGIIHYTVGQRRGLGLSGARDALYVVRIDAPSNTVVVGTQAQLFAAGLKAGDLNWIAWDAPPDAPKRVQAKIRFRHKAADAMLVAGPGKNVQNAAVTFEHPQSAVTPGQTVVFYEGDLVLGSGTIHG